MSNYKKFTEGFYQGKDVDKRMDEMRAAILYARENWNDNEFKKSFLKKLSKRLNKRLFDETWCDLPQYKPRIFKYKLIKAYTSSRGYNNVFSGLNESMREDGLENLKDALETETEKQENAFLVEYMNVELYNWIQQNKKVNKFEGCVYRGLKVSKNQIDNLANMKNKPLPERKIAVPLSFMSSSLSEKVALKFVKISRKKEKDPDPNTEENLLFEIHVANMSEEHLALYHRYFPNSVVSSLCAVPIQKLSIYKYEKEVLLRGAFFHLLDFYKSDKDFINGKPVYVAEVFMMNSNRDHLTTSQFEGTPARKLFNALVNIDKFKKARDFVRNNAEIKSYIDEEQKWREKLQDVLQELENGK